MEEKRRQVGSASRSFLLLLGLVVGLHVHNSHGFFHPIVKSQAQASARRIYLYRSEDNPEGAPRARETEGYKRKDEGGVITETQRPSWPGDPSSLSSRIESNTNSTYPLDSDWNRYGQENAALLQELRTAAMRSDVIGAQAAIETLEGRGVRPDLRALTHLMQAHAGRRDVEGAKAILDRMEAEEWKPDIVPYSILLNLHAEKGDIEASESSFKELVDRGLPASTKAYTALMKAYACAKHPEGAEDVLFRLAAAGQMPDIHTYTILLRAYAKRGDLAGAEDVMRRVLMADLRPDIVIFNALLRLHAKHRSRNMTHNRRRANVQSVLIRMKQSGVQPDETTRGLLLSLQEAIEGKEKQMHSSATGPVAATTPARSPAGVSQSRKPSREQDDEESAPEKVVALEKRLNDMIAACEAKGEGIVPPEGFFLDVLRAFVETGDEVGARRVLAKMEPPSLAAHNIMLHLHAKRGETSCAERVLGLIQMNGMMPSLTSYNTLLQAYVRKTSRSRRMALEEYKRVIQVYALLRQSTDPSMWPDSYTITAMLRCLQIKRGEAFRGPYTTVMRDLETLLPIEGRSSQLYTALIGAASVANDWERIEQAYSEAKAQMKGGRMPPRAFDFVKKCYQKIQAQGEDVNIEVMGKGGQERIGKQEDAREAGAVPAAPSVSPKVLEPVGI